MTFDADKAIDTTVRWIKEFFEETGGKTAVIGLSGGKDSTVTAALCAKALGKENVFGVIIPDGEMPDIKVARRAAKLYCGEFVIKNIHDARYDIMDYWFTGRGELDTRFEYGSEQARINMPARLRMVALYWVAQCLGHGRVANTCNLSEDWVGYATRYGDGAGDFAPLGQFTVQEVKAMGRALGVPVDLVEKVPSDGLQDKTDEDNLGFTYEVLDAYIRTGEKSGKVDFSIYEKIDRLHRLNEFKLKPIPSAPNDQVAMIQPL